MPGPTTSAACEPFEPFEPFRPVTIFGLGSTWDEVRGEKCRNTPAMNILSNPIFNEAPSERRCKPCAFFWKNDGCQSGQAGNFLIEISRKRGQQVTVEPTSYARAACFAICAHPMRRSGGRRTYKAANAARQPVVVHFSSKKSKICRQRIFYRKIIER